MPVCYSSHQAHGLIKKKKTLTLMCEPFQRLLLVSAHLDARMGLWVLRELDLSPPR